EVETPQTAALLVKIRTLNAAMRARPSGQVGLQSEWQQSGCADAGKGDLGGITPWGAPTARCSEPGR
ncbi:MAG: hypothetical protein QOK02_4765, partial [Mycobacterium sp.]|nr:hypothetical protein [Mycobacterium sp.]